MIRIKTKEEIEILRQGGKILADVLDKVVATARPGVSTIELEKLACELIAKAGGRPSFKNHKMHDGKLFPTALCISANDEIVHAPAVPARKLNSGDVVGIDIGMEYPVVAHRGIKNKFSEKGGFYTDMSRTIAIGKISKEAKKLISVTKECLDLSIKQVKPGNTLSDIGRVISQHAEANGFSVVRDLVGHGVGHDVHEDPYVPNYELPKNSPENFVLKPGMVIAIEPMVNMGTWEILVGEDGMSIKTADGKLSAHFEHTVAVTEQGHEILTVN